MKFDLIDVLETIFRRRKFILLITGCALIIGALFCFLQKNEYTSQAIVIVKSPQIMDRGRTYHVTGYDPTVFFATNDDVDHVVTIAKSDALAQYIVDKFGLMKEYGFKMRDKATDKFRKKFTLTRNDTKNIELSFTGTDPQKAFEITQEIVNHIESVYQDYFNTIDRDMVNMLEEKIEHMKDTLVVLDDSIRNIRNTYNLQNVLLPTRGVVVQGNVNISGTSSSAMEMLQEVVFLKDAYVTKVNEFTGLAQEYMGKAKRNTSLFYRVQDAYVPDKPSFPKIPIVLMICLAGGLLFSASLVCMMEYYRRLKQQ